MAETDTVEPVAAAESSSFLDFRDRGVGCAMVVLDKYGKNRSENGVRGRRDRPAAGTAPGSGDGSSNTSDESPRGSKKAVNSCTWLLCAKQSVEVKGGLPKTACSVRGTSPPK